MSRDYDALVLDLDGTLVGEDQRIRPRTLAALEAAARAGVHVMVATGRSELAAQPILDELARLGIDSEAIVYNGAALLCPREGGLVEKRTLTDGVRDFLLDHAEERGYLPVVMVAGSKLAPPPRNPDEQRVLRKMHALRVVEVAELRVPDPIRVTLFSNQHPSSGDLCAEVEALLPAPAYLTHFDLAVLSQFRDSDLLVLDVHPDCRGKAEAFRVLEERYGIPASRVVAIGDASNDLPLLAGAGLGVCMAEAVEEVRAVSQRVIGSCESDTIAELIDELFL